jgi:hypothetical protein
VTPSPARTRFVITLEGAIDNDAANIRTLRLLLKHLLRMSGLRCIDARQFDHSHNGHHWRDAGYREGDQ